MKDFLFLISFACTVFAAKSQNLSIEGSTPNLYIIHTVAPKDNFYSVGRLYNQNSKAIAAFNNLVMEKGLVIGQKIKIPLNEQNLDISGNNMAGTVALTHIVGKGESLSKIGSDVNVSVQSIKNWNKLSSDNVASGTALVVGYLKMSSTAGLAKNTNIQSVAPKQEPVNEEVSVSVAKNSENKEASPAVKQVETPASVTSDSPVKQEVAKASAPTQTPKKEEISKPESYSYTNTSSLSSIEGVFANVFTADVSQKSVSSKSGEAATFKSTSGWQDKKYYILMNDVAPGTIVKIASSDNKLVYAKVLGSMPDMKENNGLLLRLSNAAASYLGIIDPKFPVQVSYYQ